MVNHTMRRTAASGWLGGALRPGFCADTQREFPASIFAICCSEGAPSCLPPNGNLPVLRNPLIRRCLQGLARTPSAVTIIKCCVVCEKLCPGSRRANN